MNTSPADTPGVINLSIFEHQGLFYNSEKL